MDILKSKVTRGNEIRCRIFGNTRSVQKCAQNAGSNVLKTYIMNFSATVSLRNQKIKLISRS